MNDYKLQKSDFPQPDPASQEVFARFLRVCRSELCELAEEPTEDIPGGWCGRKIWVGIYTITEEDDGTLTATRDGTPTDFTIEDVLALEPEIQGGLYRYGSLQIGTLSSFWRHKRRQDHGPCEQGVYA